LLINGQNFNKDNFEAYDYASKQYGYLSPPEIDKINIKTRIMVFALMVLTFGLAQQDVLKAININY
jgi:hypothetical protein